MTGKRQITRRHCAGIIVGGHFTALNVTLWALFAAWSRGRDSGVTVRCRHTGLVIFTIYADLEVDRPVQDEAAAFGANFRPEDSEVCVWVDEDRPNVLRVSYDLDIDAQADNFQAAIQAALAELKRSLATMSFDAWPVSVNASTDEAQATWTKYIG
jgi:hypothetical protein